MTVISQVFFFTQAPEASVFPHKNHIQRHEALYFQFKLCLKHVSFPMYMRSNFLIFGKIPRANKPMTLKIDILIKVFRSTKTGLINFFHKNIAFKVMRN